MYDKCYFCLDQLLKLKKESTASFFVNFGRSRGTKGPTYITVKLTRYKMVCRKKVTCLACHTLPFDLGFKLLLSQADPAVRHCNGVKGFVLWKV